MQKKRIVYLDAMRALLIVLIIYSHVIGLSISPDTGHPPPYYSSNYLIRDMVLPLFFLVSGFLSFAVFDFRKFKKKLVNRISTQLWPTILIGTALTLFIGEGFTGFFTDIMKSGYWFTFCLVQMWLIYAVIALVCRRLGLSGTQELITMSAIAVILLPAATFLSKYTLMNSYPVYRVMSGYFTLKYVPYFFMGVVLKMVYDDLTIRISDKKWIVMAAIGILSFAFMESDRFFLKKISEVATVFMVFFLLFYTRSFWEGDTLIARSLRFLGNGTLAIYLLHFFIIHYLRMYHLADGLHPLVGNVWLELPVFLALSYAIALACAGADWLLKKNKYIHRIIFGQ